MGLERKFLSGAVIADASLGERQIRVIASDSTVDRVKDVMVPKGCVLDGYVNNNIVLADHDAKSAIGNAEIEVKPDRVEGLITFAPKGISARADEYCGLYKAGVLKAVSVGFDPIEWEPIKDGGLLYTKWALMELSCVAVPANPNAITVARSLQKAEEHEWKVGASRNLPTSDEDSWDGPAAAASIFEHAKFDGNAPDTSFARKGFLFYDAAAPKLKGSYKEPFAKMVDGRLTATKGGVKAAASRLPQTDVPDDVSKKGRAILDHYEKKLGIGDEDKGTNPMTIKAAIIRKGMYGCAQLAAMIEDLGWVVNSSAWEAEMEGDGSKVPSMLAEGLRQLADAFVAMSAEEVSELLASVTPPAADKAARTAKLKTLLPRGRIAVKAGRRFSQANQEHLDGIDKCMKSIDDVRGRIADLHDDAAKHTEEMQGHVDEAAGYVKAMRSNKAADNSEHLDGIDKCMTNMGGCCQKMVHLHDYLHDHMVELEQHVAEAAKHVDAMQKSAKKPEEDDDSEADDVTDPSNSDQELAAEVEARKRLADIVELERA